MKVDMKAVWLALAFALFVLACTKVLPPGVPVVTNTETSTDVTTIPEDCAKNKWCYDKEAESAITRLGAELLKAKPSDGSKWCSSFTSHKPEERKAFYVKLLKALSFYESTFNPDAYYQENFKDRHGNFIISRGLLQLSIESGNGYGCGFKMETDLHDVQANLDCGVRIMTRWITGDGVIQGGGSGAWKGMARYWSPFRKSDRITSMKTRIKNELSFCN